MCTTGNIIVKEEEDICLIYIYIYVVLQLWLKLETLHKCTDVPKSSVKAKQQLEKDDNLTQKSQVLCLYVLYA